MGGSTEATGRTEAMPGQAQASGSEAVGVAVVSDVRLVREALAILLARSPACRVVASFGSAVAARALTTELACQVALLDMRTEGSRELCALLRVLPVRLKIVGFAVEETPDEVISCAELGLSAYVSREGRADDLIEAVNGAVAGRLICPPHIAGSLFGRLRDLSAPLGLSSGATRLTRREREVVTLVARDFSNKEIARQLHLSAATVKNHVHNVMEKLGVHRRAQVGLHLRAPG